MIDAMRFAIALILVAGAAHADEPDARTRAKAAFAAGMAAYEAGRFREATQHFLDGYALAPLPALLFNAAQACRREWEIDRDRAQAARAIDLYRRYLAQP